jgi:glyceraldehyde-3-phosphate dehydrogenase [NAD(P)+]
MKLEFPEICEEMYEKRNDRFYVKNFINGGWDFHGEEFIEVNNPYDGSTVGFVPKLGSENVDMAIRSAWKNRNSIREVPAIERIELFENAAKLLEKNEDLLVNSLVLEAGKPIHNAKGEVRATINRLNMVAEEARMIFGEYIPGDWSEDTMQKFAMVLREPIGVVLAISPFNYPLFITSAKVIPALLAGNSVIVKLPSADPITFLMFTRILEEVGLPKGALTVMTTSGETMFEHVDNPRICAITFTGSTEVGKKIAKKAGMRHFHLELGGNGVALVLPNADLDLAADKVVHGALNFSGQRCDAVSRVVVVGDIADEFVSRVLDRVNGTKYGDPWEEDTKVGPLIRSRSLEWVDELVKDAVNQGARILAGGRPDSNSVYQPTLLDHTPRKAKIMLNETFGPVIPIHRVKDMEEAMEMINDSDFGLDSCVFTKDFYEAWHVAKKMKDGEITVNDAPSHGVGYFPFGGTGESGIGREGIGYSIEEMTRLKTVVFNLAPAKLGKKRKIYPI